jgi:hypothetical protein
MYQVLSQLHLQPCVLSVDYSLLAWTSLNHNFTLHAMIHQLIYYG